MDIGIIINESIDRAFQELKENKDNYNITQDIIKDSGNLFLVIRNKNNNKYWGNKFSIEDFSKEGFIKVLDRVIKEAVEKIRD